MLSEARWEMVQATLVSALDSRRASKPAKPQSTSPSNFLTSAFSHLSIFGSHRNTGSATMSDSHNPSAVIHPSTFLAEMLLRKHPGADVAVVHDDHWGAVIGENEDRMATGPELWRRVQTTFDTVLNCKGAMYLSERSATPHGIITQPESSIPSKKVIFAGPSAVFPLPSTTSIAAAQAPASPQSHARISPMVKGKSATVIAPSEAQNEGSQSTATSFAPALDHRSDFVGVSIGFTPFVEIIPQFDAVNSEMDAFPNVILVPPYEWRSLQFRALHIRAPSWSHLLRLLAQSSASRLEATSQGYFELHTVVQCTDRADIILWFTIDRPVVFEQSQIYAIPATYKLPHPTLPITFPDLALYLQAALEESKHIHNESAYIPRLADLIPINEIATQN